MLISRLFGGGGGAGTNNNAEDAHPNVAVDRPSRMNRNTPLVDNTGEVAKPRQAIHQKLVVVGQRESGKSALLDRFVNDDFSDDYVATQAVDYLHKRIPLTACDVVFCLFDVGGEEDNPAAAALAVLDATCILFTFDLSRPQSLDWIQTHYKGIRLRNPNAVSCLVGTKFDQFLDLDMDEQRSTTAKTKEFARLMNCPLIYTSASHSINVQRVFKLCLSLIFGIVDHRMEQITGEGEPLLLLSVAAHDA